LRRIEMILLTYLLTYLHAAFENDLSGRVITELTNRMFQCRCRARRRWNIRLGTEQSGNVRRWIVSSPCCWWHPLRIRKPNRNRNRSF